MFRLTLFVIQYKLLSAKYKKITYTYQITLERHSLMSSMSWRRDYISLFKKHPLLMRSAHIEPHLLYSTLPWNASYTFIQKSFRQNDLETD